MIFILLSLSYIFSSECLTEVYRFDSNVLPSLKNNNHEVYVDFRDSVKLISAPSNYELAYPVTTLKGLNMVRFVWKIKDETYFMLRKHSNYVEIAFSNLACKKSKKSIVVIDPGHGGKDPGAEINKKINEKNLVLEYAIALRDYITKNSEHDVYLTRNDDSFISLSDRIAFAESYQADLLLSIHADAFNNSNIHGASVYGISFDKASSSQAEFLSQIEVDDKIKIAMIYDVKQRQNILNGLRAANLMLSTMKKNYIPLHNRKVESAGFVILSSARVPSVLLEIGYLSSNLDVKRLLSKQGKDLMLASIGDAVIQYLATSRSVTRK